MTILAMVAILVGAVLGLRFKVLILLPAIAVALTAILAAGLASADGLPRMALAAVLTISGLEVGYLFGVTARYLTVGRTSLESEQHQPARSFTKLTS